jgi:hypothetical protein
MKTNVKKKKEVEKIDRRKLYICSGYRRCDDADDCSHGVPHKPRESNNDDWEFDEDLDKQPYCTVKKNCGYYDSSTGRDVYCNCIIYVEPDEDDDYMDRLGIRR